MRLPSVFDRYRSAIDAELRSAMAGRDLPMYDMLRYHLGWIDERGGTLPGGAGKALRPTLCLLACEAISGDYRNALPAAGALELVHNFSLIHDDIQDNDRERRHRPTVWSIWGIPQAINAGDALHLVASLALFRLCRSSVPAHKIIKAQQMLEESCLSMIEGQYLDLSFENRLDIGQDDYLDMISRKTGALMECSLGTGALLASEDETTLASFKEFGRNLGLAFQIKDDLLGIWGNQQETGKPLGSDIQRGKNSFPIVYALEKANGTSRTTLGALYRNKPIDGAGVRKVMDILETLNARAQTQKMAEECRDRALEALHGLTLSEWARSNLEEVAQFSVTRGF